ncbi:MAG: WecB/TagA/CpsF family glycosyltransferase [Anaeromicrobium sp.]|jgi:N-acetylglucosaminyldiphosphoundecaprenol N-acetyl-beta-D-mannosaminyltransferase|uniref:WecB/TagA/CpsF family glycosyltransferase n=1 Tax=Anaeromicrobium sp. TaxID=1929132 RepID=UPI0025FCC8B9|nr:WecB/TagA/CpsF family glycosyltransferase [Anaeromicrobium sp.]MCT4595834.1 WecB/TagA/CpsF family glycosyltransferase [Anaeromicrobium sp.]
MRNVVHIMGVPIDKGSLVDATNRIKELLDKDGCSQVVTPNTEIVMVAQEDKDLLKIIKEADLVIPDGIGLVYASKIKKKGLTQRVTGVDLMAQILKYCNEEEKSIYLFGGKPNVANMAAENILKKFPNIKIAGTQDGYYKIQDEEKIIDRINEIKPDVLFTALGAPRQEKLIYKYKDILKVKLAAGVGGSVDIWAGTAKRAPEIYQKLGLEWFYRLMKEPWRYKRMLVLPKFMIKVILTKDI